MPTLHHTRMTALSELEQLYVGGSSSAYYDAVGTIKALRFGMRLKITETILRVSPFGKLIIGYVPYCEH